MKLPNWLTAKTDGKKKNRGKKILFPALIASILLFLASAHFVHAGGFSLFGIGDLAYSVISELAFGIAYLIAWIGGVCIGVAAWLVGAMLAINTGVFQSTVVQQGFGVTLAIANLGFVLGIIVIAIATILQNNTYGIKQLLWKLVVAAIMVNFSLVIMAPVFGFSNNVTQYFLNCIDPAGGGCNATGNGFISAGGGNSMNDFAVKLAGSFNPQVGFATLNTSTISGVSSNSTVQGAFSTVGADFSKMLLPIISILFVALECIMVVIVLFAIVVMLLIRYLYIACLAILMPFAWLCWVFPKLNSHWNKWWADFIRWTLFAPIMVFFLYLAILTMAAMSSAGATGSQAFATYTSSSNVFWGSISSFFTSAFTPIIQSILNMIIMLGLSVAGIFVANSMGIKGADVGMKAVGSVKNGVVGYAGKQAKKRARSAYDNGLKIKGRQVIPTGRSITNRLQEGRIGPLGWIPGGRRLASITGRGISSVSSNVALVDAAKKNIPSNPEEIRARLRGSMSTEDQLAHVSKLVDMGEFREKNDKDEDEMINGQTVRSYLNKNLDKGSNVARLYGQVKMGGDANKAIGSDKDMRDAEENLKKFGATTAAGIAAMNSLNEATKQFVEKLGKADMAKMSVNDVLGKDSVLSRALMKRFALSAPELVPAALPKMKSKNLKAFDVMYEETLANEITNAEVSGDARAIERLKKTRDNYRKSFGKNTTGVDEESTPTPTPGPTPTPTP